jgi:hypothetical protein
MDAYPTAVVHASKVWVPEQNIAQSTDYFAFRVARHSRIWRKLHVLMRMQAKNPPRNGNFMGA